MGTFLLKLNRSIKSILTGVKGMQGINLKSQRRIGLTQLLVFCFSDVIPLIPCNRNYSFAVHSYSFILGDAVMR